MDALLAMVIGAGVWFDQPFTAAYIREVGIPEQLLNDPFFHSEIMKKMREVSMTWCYAFWVMCLVSLPAPM